MQSENAKIACGAERVREKTSMQKENIPSTKTNITELRHDTTAQLDITPKVLLMRVTN